MVVYLNTIMKWYGVTPQSNLYFYKSDLSPKKSPPGLYLGNPNKTTMGAITVTRLKYLMKKRNVDVEVVTLPSIMVSTEYKKELFLIQGYARRGKKLKKDKNGLPEAIPMWRANKGSKTDDPFFEHTILRELSVGRYIDHVLRSKNGCLILNPASHLKLHDNLEGGYFTKIKFDIKHTYTRSEDPYCQIHTSIDGVPYHTKEEELDVKEYIKRFFCVREEIGNPDPLMKNHVRIEQLVSDMNNARMRDPLQNTRTPVWASPSGDSHLLDDVFNNDEGCVKALFNEGVFNKNCIPEKKDTAEALVAKFDKLDMFDEIYVHVKKNPERLTACTYPQPRRRSF
jgi:hypothetical protein